MADYHDLFICELERNAEEELKRAESALQSGEPEAKKLVQRWTESLDTIRQIKSFAQPA